MMIGITVVWDGDHNVISKFRPPKTRSEVIGALVREGKILDNDEIQLVEQYSLEAGDYTFISHSASPIATLGGHQSGTCLEQVSTVIATPLVAHDATSPKQDGEEDCEEESMEVSEYEQVRNKKVAFNQKRFLELFPEK
jgi:hypothetical protein